MRSSYPAGGGLQREDNADSQKFLRSFWEDQQVPGDEELRVHPQLETGVTSPAAPGWGAGTENWTLQGAWGLNRRDRGSLTATLRITQESGSPVSEVVVPKTPGARQVPWEPDNGPPSDRGWLRE